eukprot:s1596_g3.t1
MARPTLLPAVAVLAGVYSLASFCFVGSPQTPRDCSRDSDVPFNAGAASGAGATVEFKKRPFGILRYQPGEGMKGAMAMEIIPKSRYPGDPQGQAFASGVQSGWVVQSINGMNVQNEERGSGNQGGWGKTKEDFALSLAARTSARSWTCWTTRQLAKSWGIDMRP